MSKISKNIKKLRVSREMTQEELATKIHVTRQTVSSWETDRTQPDLEILLALAEAFEVQVEELIYGKRKNAAEEKEKLLFSSTLVTVLSVLGCLLIGAGVVMIFMKYWYDFPNALKIFTCFVPALLGQGTGIYTYIRKKESLAWCEGASVLWMLGTGVTTTVLLSQTNTNYIDEGIVYFFLAVCFFVLMLLFKSLSPLAVVYGFSLVSFVSALENSDYYYIRQGSSAADIARFIIATVVEGVLIALAVFVSKKFFKKENNIILYHFSEWINFVAVVVYACIALGRLNIEGAFYSVIILTVLICFIFGHKQESFASPCKLVGTLGTAAALCFLTIITEPIEIGRAHV